jgi:hypothetical protein
MNIVQLGRRLPILRIFLRSMRVKKQIDYPLKALKHLEGFEANDGFISSIDWPD